MTDFNSIIDLSASSGPLVLLADAVWCAKGDSEPILGGAIQIENGRVSRVVSRKSIRIGKFEVVEVEGQICPGLINGHSHLELSHLRSKIKSGLGFTNWVKTLVSLPRQALDDKTVDAAIFEARASGTCWFGDICGFNPGTVAAGLQRAGVGATIFAEHLGFYWKSEKKFPDLAGYKNFRCPEKLHLASTGHALYSTLPAMLQALKRNSAENRTPFSIHLAEHCGEIELLERGLGEFKDLLKKRMLPADYIHPGKRPVKYADELGLLDEYTLAVHCVQVNESEVDILKKANATVCLCPRSNEYIGVGQAPWELYINQNVPLCLGTDSLASNWDLNLWKETLYLLENCPQVGLGDVLKMITSTPAKILGLAGKGRIEPGMEAVFSLIPDYVLEVAGR